MPLKICENCARPYDTEICPYCATAILRSDDDQGDDDRVWEEGEVLGHFKIVRLLGEGGMNRVYEAEDRNLHRKVALKVPKQKFLAHPNAREWFRLEGEALGRIENDYIVKVLNSEDYDGTICHVLEFVPGETLSQRIRSQGPLPQREAAEIARNIASGLEEVHLHGRCHGDVKPSNIVLGNKPKLIDFGLAWPFTSPRREGAAGTLEYMSPECEQGDSSGVDDDVYGLGVTLFEMLCGRTPRAGGRLVPDGKTRNGDSKRQISPPLVAIVERLIARKPLDRPATIRQVRQLLEGWLNHEKKRQLRTIGGVVVATVLLACVFLCYRAIPRGSVVILSGDGSVRRRYETLPEAIVNVDDGEVLQLQSAGPFRINAAVRPRGPLIIRGAGAVTPVLEIDPSISESAALTCRHSLRLEGVVVRCLAGKSVPEMRSLFHSTGDSVDVANCRFEMPEDMTNVSCISSVDTANMRIRNTVFAGFGGTAIAWTPPPASRLQLANCLAIGMTAIRCEVSEGHPRGSNIRIEQCTLMGDHVLRVVPADRDRPNISSENLGKNTAVRVDAVANVFCTQGSLVAFSGWPVANKAKETMAANLDWRDLQNLHATDRDRIVDWSTANGNHASFRADSLTAWTPYWGKEIDEIDAIILLGVDVSGFVAEGAYADVTRDLVTRLHDARKTLCAIGVGPAILADYGLLKGQAAAGHSLVHGALKAAGAELSTDRQLVRSDQIVTAESNFHTRDLVGYLPSSPTVLALIAEDGFWFDDLRAVKFEVERAGGIVLTVSSNIDIAKPDPAGGGGPIRPDLLLPLLRWDAEVSANASAPQWLTTTITPRQLLEKPDTDFEITAECLVDPQGKRTPGIHVDAISP